MKRIAVLLTFMLLPALTSAQQVTFTMQAPEEGRTRSVVDTMELIALISFSAEGADQAFDMEQGERKAYTETVLAVDDAVVTKKRLAFTEASKRSTQPMQPAKVKESPVVGKAYIVEYLGDNVSVVAEDGSEVGKEEQEYIAEGFKRRAENQFGKILDGRSMSVGEELELKDDLLKEFGAGLTQGPMTVRTAKLRLQSLGEKNGMQTAVFDVDVVIGGTQGMMEMEIAMTGTAEVGVDNLWPLSLIMSGTLSGAGEHAGANLTADGDMRLARIAVYE